MEIRQNNVTPLVCRSVEQEIFAPIKEQQRANMKMGPFCARHQIVRSRYYHWLKKYRNRQPAQNSKFGFTLPKLESECPNPLFCDLVTPDRDWVRFFQPVGLLFKIPAVTSCFNAGPPPWYLILYLSGIRQHA